jgi:hypothetical protein
MKLPQPTDVRAVEVDLRRAAGVEQRMGVGRGQERPRRDQGFQVPFDVVEVDRALGDPPLLRQGGAIRETADPQRLIAAFVAVAQEAPSDLEDTDPSCWRARLVRGTSGRGQAWCASSEMARDGVLEAIGALDGRSGNSAASAAGSLGG